MRCSWVRTAVPLISLLFLTACEAVFQTSGCSDPAGCVRVPPGGSIFVATIQDTSGDYAAIGTDAKRGVELAARDQGKLLGHDLQIVQLGTDCTEAGARSAATQLALNPDLLAAIGPGCAGEWPTIRIILEDAGIDTLFPSYDSRSTGANLDLSASYAVSRLKAGHAVILEEAPDLLGADATLQQSLLRLDCSVRSLNVPAGSLDFTEPINILSAELPDVLFLHLPPAQAGRLVARIRSIPALKNMIIFGWQPLLDPTFIQSAGPSALGTYMTGPDDSIFGPGYPAFVARYEQAFGEKPIASYHLDSYAAAQAIFQAIEQTASSRNGSLSIPRGALRAALHKMANDASLFGAIHCAEGGACGVAFPAVYQITSTDPSSWNLGVNPKQVFP